MAARRGSFDAAVDYSLLPFDAPTPAPEVKEEPAPRASGTKRSLPQDAKARKASREKQRRSVINERFQELSRIVDPESTHKGDKGNILGLAIKELRRVHDENWELKEQNLKLEDMLCAERHAAHQRNLAGAGLGEQGLGGQGLRTDDVIGQFKLDFGAVGANTGMFNFLGPEAFDEAEDPRLRAPAA